MTNSVQKREFIKQIIRVTIIGMLSGLVSVLFNVVVSGLMDFFHSISEVKTISLLTVPIIAGGLVGLIRQFTLDKKSQGFSVSQVMLDLDVIKTLLMQPRSVILKIIGTFITLGGGFSAGRQGPIVHIGGAIGANVAYWLKLDDQETRLLIGAGIAGCLAGVFNAPLFATLFVIEILFNKKYIVHIYLILLASISSIVFRTYVIQSQPFFKLDLNFTYNTKDFGYFILIGVIAGVFSLLYTYLLLRTKQIFEKINLICLRTLIGGCIVGLSLYYIPQLYNRQYESIEFVLTQNLSIKILLGILLLKIVLTAISLGSGGLGGSFNPGIYIGALIGFISGTIINSYGFGGSTTFTYAAVGMAAMFAGFAHAPLTATIMVVELTGHYELIFPVVIANLASSSLSSLIYHKSLYDIELDQLKSDYFTD